MDYLQLPLYNQMHLMVVSVVSVEHGECDERAIALNYSAQKVMSLKFYPLRTSNRSLLFCY